LNSTYLAFDFGTKRIGVAVGRSRSGHADALETVAVRHGQPDWRHIGRLVEEWQPDALVVGLPLNMDDTENEITPLARRFGNQLHGRYNLTVHMVDERLTTRAAYDDMVAAGLREHRRRETADRFAARHILQTFLNDMAHEQR
jgi:putative Holliday junction resolvase